MSRPPACDRFRHISRVNGCPEHAAHRHPPAARSGACVSARTSLCGRRDLAVERVAVAARVLIQSPATTADPCDREIEATRANTKAAVRFGDGRPATRTSVGNEAP